MSQLPPPIPAIPAQQPPTIPGALNAGVQPHRGGLILGLGIGSLGVWFLAFVGALAVPCCGASGLISLGMAIPAWIMANTDLAAMRAGRMDPSGMGTTNGGRICAIISVVIHALGLLIAILLLVLGLAIVGVGAASGGSRP